MGKAVLIVDDELDIQSSLAFALRDENYEVLTASSPAEAEKILAEHPVDIGLFDVWFPEGDGIELLKTCKARYPQATFIMMSGHGNIELALKAIRLGAYDFLEKPLELEKVLVVLRNAAETLSLRSENRRLFDQISSKGELIGESGGLKSLRQDIQKAAQGHSPVLIQGENGTGKELVAQLLHREGPRRDKPFVAINCAAVPESLFESELFGHEKGAFTGAHQRGLGRFEQAAGGTLFLDEISELSLSAQGKLLRVLEEKRYERVGGRLPLKAEARVLAASNRDLPAEVRAGRFREDLFFRLNVISLQVKPLRERREDIPVLSAHFVKIFAAEYGKALPEIRPELMQWFQKYEWPGNVRELKNLIERMLLMSETPGEALGLDDLPEELQAGSALPTLIEAVPAQGSLRDLRAAFERSILSQRLQHFGGNITRTAESLGIERAHLHRKLKQYALGSAASFREESRS